MTDLGGFTAVHVLGPIVLVRADGGTVDPGSPTQRRLLALLALAAPRAVHRDRVGAALGLSPSAVRTTVSRLRRTVGRELVTTTTGYRLDLPVDAAVLCRELARAGGDPDALGRVLDRWGGAAIEEFAAEPWAAGEAARLDEIRATAGEDRAEALIDAGRAAEALPDLDLHVAVHRYRDRGWGLLVRALAATGRQALALRAFQRYRRELLEVGTEPSEPVCAVERRVAAGWDGVGAARPSVGTPPTAWSVPLPPELAPSGPVVGRERELGALAHEVGAVRTSGRLRVVTLLGEEGAGKTTLLAEFARREREPLAVLYGRGGGLGAVPLQCLRSVVAAVVDHAPTELLADHAARHGGVLLELAPRLAHRIDVRVSVATDDSAAVITLAEAAADLLTRAASRAPLALLLDDVDRDPASLALMGRLARALAESPVLLVVGGHGTDDPTDTVRPLLAELARLPGLRLELSGLDVDAVDVLVGHLLGATAPTVGAAPSEAAVALRQDTGGNALFVVQLARHWVAERRITRGADGGVRLGPETGVPASLRDIVRHRVAALGPTARTVLTAVAVLGDDGADRLLQDVVDLPAGDVLRALDAAASAGLLAPAGPDRVRFAHALVSAVILSDATGPERRDLHARTAAAMLARTDALGDARPAALARHFEAASRLADAMHWASVAGDEALDALAPSAATTWYATAERLAAALGRPVAERLDLQARRGRALVRAGDPDGLAVLVDAAERAWHAGAPGPLVQAALATDRGFVRLDEFATQQLRLVEWALAAATPEPSPVDPGDRARLLALLGQSLVHTGETDRRRAAALEALDLARRSDDPTLLARLAPAALYALWLPGTAAERMRLAMEAIESAERSGDRHLCFVVHSAAYNAAVSSGDASAARRSDARRRDLVPALGDRGRWVAGVSETFQHTMACRFADAGRVADETVNLGLEIGEPDAFTLYAGQLYALRTFEGRHGELLPLVEQVMAAGPVLLPFRIGHGILCAAVGREDEARAVLEAGLADGFAAVPADLLWLTSIIGYAVLATELGHRAAAAPLLALITPHASEVAFNGSTSQGPVAAYLGKLALLLGDHDAAEGHLRAALALADEFGWTYHRATTLFALADARHRRDGRLDGEARELLAEAGAICHATGMRGWAERVDRLAGRTAPHATSPARWR